MGTPVSLPFFPTFWFRVSSAVGERPKKGCFNSVHEEENSTQIKRIFTRVT